MAADETILEEEQEALSDDLRPNWKMTCSLVKKINRVKN